MHKKTVSNDGKTSVCVVQGCDDNFCVRSMGLIGELLCSLRQRQWRDGNKKAAQRLKQQQDNIAQRLRQ